MPQSLTQQLADFIHRTNFQKIAPISTTVKQHFLDTLGCCIAAVNSSTNSTLKKFILSEGGIKQATAIGMKQFMPASQAAFMNGLLARSVEFDDMVMPDLHPSGVLVPIALAMAEINQVTGEDVIASLATALEIFIRLARAGYDPISRNSRFLKRGQDSTAICGAVAGAGLAAKLLGLNKDEIVNAMGIVVSFASGSLEANRSGGNVKQLQSGWAAKSAIQAALLTKYGITGPLQALEGRYGFYQCFIDGNFDPLIITETLGVKWLLSEMRYKPYPCNYYTHAGIDAALAVQKKGLKIEEIESIHAGVALPMLRTTGEPIERKQNPQNAYEAKFSAPYTIAAALMGGKGLGLGLDDFTDDLVKEPTRVALMKKITLSEDEECNAIFPNHAPAILTFKMKNNKQLIEKILVNRGSSQNPLTAAEIALKFKTNAHGILSVAKTNKLNNLVKEMEKLKNIKPIVNLLK